MKRSSFILGLLAVAISGVGCEGLGKSRKDSRVAGLPGSFEPQSPVEGARGLSESARPRGAWSREASEIEKSLNNRSADSQWSSSSLW